MMAFSEWFNENGGSCFIVNSRVDKIMARYPNNNYFYIDLGLIKKAVNNQNYVHNALAMMDRCDFYYAYNIPLKHSFSEVNWFHLSNVLPLIDTSSYGIPLTRRVELWWLGRLIKAIL